MDRALRLLLMFRTRPAIRIVDAARELGVAPSTVHRLLAMLMAYEFVSQDPETQAYLPGEILVELGVRAVNRWDLVEAAQPVLADLAAESGETVSLGVLRHADVLVVAAAESERIVRIAGGLGSRIPAFHSAMGRVLLAELPADRLRRIYPDQTLRDDAFEIVMDRDALETELARVREQGFATNDLPRSMDYASTAVPVRRGGRVVAAMALAVPRQRVTEAWPGRALHLLRCAVASLEAPARAETA